MGDEIRNVYFYRATLFAGGIFAVEATSGLFLGLLFRVAEGHLVEVTNTLSGFCDGIGVFVSLSGTGNVPLRVNGKALVVPYLCRCSCDAWLVPIDLVTVELRTVHTGEFGLTANADAAGTAHSRTVHHDGVHADSRGTR
jgi:hypothetical protein